MKKTFVTTMPDRVGAFLEASRCFAAQGVNITRVSYDKAIDIHTLFLEVEAEPDALANAERALASIGYYRRENEEKRVVLLQFLIPDEPGRILPLLELIARFDLNISYMNSHAAPDTTCQHFRMGLLVSSRDQLAEFLQQAAEICPVKLLPMAEHHTYDNSIFYDSFTEMLCSDLDLPTETLEQLKICINHIIQNLDGKPLSPDRTFSLIRDCAAHIFRYAGENFHPRITEHCIAEGMTVTVIEPPCGSNTLILQDRGQYLFIDTGYTCYEEEMRSLFHQLISDFDTIEKPVLVTHADFDHCGLLSLFSPIYLSKKSRDSLLKETQGKPSIREENAFHEPYVQMYKLLTSHRPAPTDRFCLLTDKENDGSLPLMSVGKLDFGRFHFEIFEGAGGHIPGEWVLVDQEHAVIFSGDIYINLHGLTPEQAAYISYAPQLMTSVDFDASLAAAERKAMLAMTDDRVWRVFSSHGLPKELIPAEGSR